MTRAVPIRRAAVAELDAVTFLLRELVDEVRGLRADLARTRAPATDALIGAIREEVGATGRFTSRSVLAIADDDPHGALADALFDVGIDSGSPERARATKLGG